MPNHSVFIYRKTNGGAYVHPAVLTVRNSHVIRFWNISGCVADVKFRKNAVVSPDPFAVNNGAYVDVTVTLTPKTPEYCDYKVKLTCERALGHSEQWAEGASDPGIIVDP